MNEAHRLDFKATPDTHFFFFLPVSTTQKRARLRLHSCWWPKGKKKLVRFLVKPHDWFKFVLKRTGAVGLTLFFFFCFLISAHRRKKRKGSLIVTHGTGMIAQASWPLRKKVQKKAQFFFFPPCYCALTLDYISNIHLSFHTPQL